MSVQRTTSRCTITKRFAQPGNNNIGSRYPMKSLILFSVTRVYLMPNVYCFLQNSIYQRRIMDNFQWYLQDLAGVAASSDCPTSGKLKSSQSCMPNSFSSLAFCIMFLLLFLVRYAFSFRRR
ncbi:uncharacterized protein LY89DRAFT_350030 [Mollisia scopiformis]|uniref:Uncharacterized protein n=1 Tax=Mollisia scopiformis TaxID=149040 RepID=A0A132B6S6_MOLSC|nr:uncharacterized protein LY89DRAFT_350030 [Mollisia scopiformis]KUJ08116.1 hypothetical protein LY89DRAFT_350030 [Mollisia scopiformis]